MQIPLLDLKREYAAIKPEIDSAVLEALSETRYINGPQVNAFEEAVARYCQCKHAIGVASGTDALLLSLRAAGVGRDDEVITTAFSFFATAGTIHNVGARAVFVDIDSDNFNLRVDQIEARITPRTKAIMPVHLFGQCADLDPIMDIAERHGLVVIEDAAQSISAKYRGRMSGTIGQVGCFSFYPTKNLGCAGDGGMIVTNSDDYEQKLRRLKAHGAAIKYYHAEVGYNSRLDTIQAALLLVKLPHLGDWSAARRANAAYYSHRFADSGIKIPKVEDYGYHIFNQYTIRVGNRDGLRDYLQHKGIGFEIYYPKPLHLQECFRYLGYREGDLLEAEACAKQVISIPIYPWLTEAEREYVADMIFGFIS
jgi:dTDP-4-amino-4,6-dideoxygalactose transaminase